MKKVIVFLALALPAFAQFGNATRIQGRPVTSTAPSDTNVICWDASAVAWKPCTAGGGSLAFSSVAAGTNTAALVMGTGGSLTVSGSGTINATSLGGNLAATYAPLASPSFTGTVSIGATVLTLGNATFPGHTAIGPQAIINTPAPNTGVGGGPTDIVVTETVTTIGGATGIAAELTLNPSGNVGVKTVGIGGALITSGGFDFSVLYGVKGASYHGGSGTVDQLWGAVGDAESLGGGGHVNSLGAFYAVGPDVEAGDTVDVAYQLFATQPFIAGTLGNLYGVWVDTPAFSGMGHITGSNVAFYADVQGGSTANAYSFWSNEQGVFRIKSDNTFDSVYQAIPALYNPQFTKYTPGAANYERIVEQWNGNVAEIGTESGGTGTLRALRFLGPSVEAVSYKTATNCSNASSPAACGSAAAGAVAIPTGVTSVALVVNTTAITANSRITLLSDDSLTIPATTCNSTLATLVGGLAVTARSAGTSFTITYNGTIATNPLCVSYTIEN